MLLMFVIVLSVNSITNIETLLYCTIPFLAFFFVLFLTWSLYSFFHCSEYEEYCCVAHDSMWSGRNLLTFQRNLLPSAAVQFHWMSSFLMRSQTVNIKVVHILVH